MKYSIIIPYRNREEHLSILLPVLSEKFQNKNYEIIVAEQNDNEKFRLSSLYNIAFKYTSGDLIIFHDVDYIPSSNVSYELKNNNPTYPVRQVLFLNSDLTLKDDNDIPAGYRHFKNDVANHWGGVFMMNTKDFKLINGFNPLYIGWGKEEEETQLRLLHKNLICERNDRGLFYALDHYDNCPPITDLNFIENHHMNNGGVSRYEKMPIYLNYAGKFFNNDIINDYCDKFSSLVTKNVIESNWVNGVFNFLNKNYNNKIFCVLTATPQTEIEYILKELEISTFFKFIIGYPTKKEIAISNVLKNYGISKTTRIQSGYRDP